MWRLTFSLNKLTMATDINYWVVGLVILIVVVLLVLFFRKNRRDEKKLVNEIQQSELRPEKGTIDDVNKDNLV